MALLQDLIQQIDDPVLRERILQETDKLIGQKKFGIVFEEHLPECTPLYNMPIRIGSKIALKTGYVSDIYTVLHIDGDNAICDRRETHEQKTFRLDEIVVIAEFGEPIYPTLTPIDTVENAPDSDLWHTLIEADNYHALQLLEYLYARKVDCIYIDPPYNTGAKDWKYNNDYVDSNDQYRHSKWLSMMEKRLRLAKRLLNPQTGVLIVTIDEHEVHHLRTLLEDVFSDFYIQMVTDVINPKGVTQGRFSRVEEYNIFCFAPNAYVADSNDNLLNPPEEKKYLRWKGLLRSGTDALRSDRENMFYPIYIDKLKKKVVGAGDSIPLATDPDVEAEIDGYAVAWPIREDGNWGRWSVGADTLRSLIAKGYVACGRYDKKRKTWGISYISQPNQKAIEEGKIIITGIDPVTGVVSVEYASSENRVIKTVWHRTSHDAGAYGSDILSAMIGKTNAFSFPKSLYAERDSIASIVRNHKNALILDFFAGSGTTLHAINLLNAEDGGHRRCILVTNNELSSEEAKSLSGQGYKPGDDAWDKLGIARSVTWPRTICSIKGCNVDGVPLSGDYGMEMEFYEPDDEILVVSAVTGKPIKKTVYRKVMKQIYPQLSEIMKSDGFKTNAAFFKLSFLDKTFVALGKQFAELLPVLWMKGGAIGRCPVLNTEELPSMLLMPENKMAVLIDETYYSEFDDEVRKHLEIQTVFIVTDSETAYREMIHNYDGKDCYQLYRDYLDNFRINTGR